MTLEPYFFLPLGPFVATPCEEHTWFISRLRIMINPPLETRQCTVCGRVEKGRWSADLLTGDKLIKTE